MILIANLNHLQHVRFIDLISHWSLRPFQPSTFFSVDGQPLSGGPPPLCRGKCTIRFLLAFSWRKAFVHQQAHQCECRRMMRLEVHQLSPS